MDGDDPNSGVDRLVTPSARPLTILAATLGIDVSALADVEDNDVLAGTFDVRSSEVANLTSSALDAFVAAYGDAGWMEVRTGDLPELTVQGTGYDNNDLADLVSEASGQDVAYIVALKIDKRWLADMLVPTQNHSLLRLFFFSTVAESELTRRPQEVETRLWPATSRRLVIAILDTDVFIHGDCLSVVGGAHVSQAHVEMREPMAVDISRIAVRRNDYVGWDSTVTTSLTPGHFQRDETAPEAGIAAKLDRLVISLVAMYLCDRARIVERPGQDAFTQVEYRGREHVAYVPVRWDCDRADIERAHVVAALDVVQWCYQTIPEQPATDGHAR